MVRIGFLINPIAGMGGRVGLKGTDGVLNEAIKRGATKQAMQKAIEALTSFQTYHDESVEWITCAHEMGAKAFDAVGLSSYSIVYTPKGSSSDAFDTKQACQKFLDSALDLLVFCGGDGTARDIVSVIQKKIPLLGIPSGVKMHSGVFGITAQIAGTMIHEYLSKSLTVGDVEIMDLDEERYRRGEWNIKLYAVAQGIIEPHYVQVGKSVYTTVSTDYVIEELSDHIHDDMKEHENCLYLFGPGGTIDSVASYLGLQNTVLGIDAIYQGKTIQQDCNEQDLLTLFESYPQRKVILSPIGAQGFILGRGNLQLSPQVIRMIGLENIIVVATPEKIMHTPLIRVDTGDISLDQAFLEKEFLMVVIGYRMSRVMRMQTNMF